jgi:hypothetical protein
MKRLELTKLIEIDPKELALEGDEYSVGQLRKAIEKLTDILILAETAQKMSSSTNGRFLIIGSTAFDSLEVGFKGCVVHRLDEIRIRRKGK